MAISNYTELRTTIIRRAARLGDVEFANDVPNFIQEAEEMIFYGPSPLLVREMEAEDTLTLTDGAADLPSDFVGLRSVVADASPQMDLSGFVPGAAADLYSGNRGTYPDGYLIVGNTITLIPNAGATELILRYYAKPPALTESTPTNWLLTKSPSAYLYGALIAAAGMMLNQDGMLQTYTQRFAAALEGLRRSDNNVRHARIIPRLREYYP